MPRTGYRGSSLTAWVLSSVLVLGVAGCGGATSARTTGLPASSDPALDAGRLLIESKCRLCHTLDRVKTAEHDEAGWQATVARMRANGAVLTEAEVQSILAYLAGR